MKRTNQARLFPVLLAAALFLLLFKIATILFGGNNEFAGVLPAAAQEASQKPNKPVTPDPVKPADAVKNQLPAAKPLAEKKPNRALHPTEAKILQRLAERRQVLSKRSKELDLRENLIKAAEQRVVARLKELKALNDKVQKVFTKQEEKKKAQLKNLVSMYTNMKPNDAARLFNRLKANVLIDVAEQMSARKMAPILAAMTSAAAERLTISLADRARGREQRQQRKQLPKIAPDKSS